MKRFTFLIIICLLNLRHSRLLKKKVPFTKIFKGGDESDFLQYIKELYQNILAGNKIITSQQSGEPIAKSAFKYFGFLDEPKIDVIYSVPLSISYVQESYEAYKKKAMDTNKNEFKDWDINRLIGKIISPYQGFLISKYLNEKAVTPTNKFQISLNLNNILSPETETVYGLGVLPIEKTFVQVGGNCLSYSSSLLLSYHFNKMNANNNNNFLIIEPTVFPLCYNSMNIIESKDQNIYDTFFFGSKFYVSHASCGGISPEILLLMTNHPEVITYRSSLPNELVKKNENSLER